MPSNIIKGKQPLQEFGQWLNKQRFSSVFVLADTNTTEECFSAIEPWLEEQPVNGLLQIPPGENNKTLYCCEDIWDEMLKNGADRQSLLINLGGGVVCDMGGFVASTFNRGIKFVNIPTTLLAMVDAAHGGKTGINFRGAKNQLGTFQEPLKTVIQPEFLATLEDRDFNAGLAEMIKHALIGDPGLWETLKSVHPNNRDEISPHIEASLQVKQRITNEDPEEKGERKKLNFGHTIGHALESYSREHDENPLIHGEAVALGMMVETQLSLEVTTLSQEACEEIKATLFRHFPDYKLSKHSIATVIDFMKSDKKNRDHKINFTLLEMPGVASIDHYMEDETIENVLAKILT